MIVHLDVPELVQPLLGMHACIAFIWTILYSEDRHRHMT